MISKADIGLESLLILISDLKCQIVNLPGRTLKCAGYTGFQGTQGTQAMCGMQGREGTQ